MFCPRCGSEDQELYEGICTSCFVKEAKIITIPQDLEITICAHCSSLLKGIKWEDSILSEEELVTLAVMENYEKSSYVQDLEVSVEILTIRGSIYECIIHAEGNVMGIKIIEEHTANVKIKKGACPDCSKYASGYFESVIQIRADKRFPSTKELQTVDQIIRDKIGSLSVKNRMAYVSDVSVIKEGVDYYIGSYKAARKITTAVKDVMGGVVQESPRLVGRDKSRGKDLYRIWISIRLPDFQKDDFIEYENRKGQVKGFDGKKILLNDLESQDVWSVLWREYNNIKVIARSSDIKTTSVTSKTPQTIQILHPETYQPVDINLNPETSDLQIGDEVKVVEIEDILYILNTRNI
ncbi:60S ribosomal export protein NMD3 [Methanobacterium sp.]|uniref:60S ribosomal export protein NMD3 n=1 Tax=Methanobacterium sp. TaxID=2164 RepID=UPI003C7584DB